MMAMRRSAPSGHHGRHAPRARTIDKDATSFMTENLSTRRSRGQLGTSTLPDHASTGALCCAGPPCRVLGSLGVLRGADADRGHPGLGNVDLGELIVDVNRGRVPEHGKQLG